jgi:hypothetical protein
MFSMENTSVTAGLRYIKLRLKGCCGGCREKCLLRTFIKVAHLNKICPARKSNRIYHLQNGLAKAGAKLLFLIDLNRRMSVYFKSLF